MADLQLILQTWPMADVRLAAPLFAQHAGGTAADRAQQLARCRGIAADRLEESAARAVVRAWREVGIVAWALPLTTLPEFARPVVARAVDLREPDVLVAQISFTAPPERIALRQVVLALPGRWQSTQLIQEQAAKKKTSAVAVMFDVATTGGIKTMLQSRPSQNQPGKTTESQSDEPMLELATVAPARRIQVFARRLDYRTLRQPARERVEDNWRLWLAELHAVLRPELAGADRLARTVTTGLVERDAIVADANDLGRTGRWLMLRAMAARLPQETR